MPCCRATSTTSRTSAATPSADAVAAGATSISDDAEHTSDAVAAGATSIGDDAKRAYDAVAAGTEAQGCVESSSPCRLCSEDGPSESESE